MKRTVAQQLGSTPHVSPLLRKARRLGLANADALLRLAVKRGCTHYRPPDFDASAVADPGTVRFSNLELAIALCSGAQDYEPLLVRCAAQMLGADGIAPPEVSRLARMERCEAIIRHIAETAAQSDVGHEVFWREILANLGTRRAPRQRAGILPHRSRFMVETGVTSSKRPHPPLTIWLRPRKPQ